MAIQLSYLASQSRNFEAMLQTYRQINLTTQSVFLVLGTFLLSRIVDTSHIERALFLEGLLLGLTFFSNIVMLKFQRVIRTRGDDVNWWHREIVRAEQLLPPEERAFTRFKIEQSWAVVTEDHVERLLAPVPAVTDDDITAILGTDIEQIRRVINGYILKGMRLIWFVIVFISLASLVIR